METKIINGKKYTKVEIQSCNINGDSKGNLFSISDIDKNRRISYDVKINYNINKTLDSSNTISLDNNSQKSSRDTNLNMKISSKSSNDNLNTQSIIPNIEPVLNNDNTNNDVSIDRNNSTKNFSIRNNYWYYILLALALVGCLYFIFIKFMG